MAASNFGWYNTLLNLYSITYEEALYKVDSYCEYENIEQTEENFEEIFEKANENLRVFDEFEMEELEQFISECNNKIAQVRNNLYYSKRQCDQDEYYNMYDLQIIIESGRYSGFRIACKDYDYVNKTHKKLIQSLFRKIARKFGMYAYSLAYRFSNGETGFSLVKKYKYEYEKYQYNNTCIKNNNLN